MKPPQQRPDVPLDDLTCFEIAVLRLQLPKVVGKWKCNTADNSQATKPKTQEQAGSTSPPQEHANNQVILHHFQYTSRLLGIDRTWKLSCYVEWCLEGLDKICLKRWRLLFALRSLLERQTVPGIDGASILPRGVRDFVH